MSSLETSTPVLKSKIYLYWLLLILEEIMPFSVHKKAYNSNLFSQLIARMIENFIQKEGNSDLVL